MTTNLREDQPQAEAIIGEGAGATWVPPVVTRFAAGAAEVGADTTTDAVGVES